ncbi:hypothetical protein [Roseisolibacter agri]|uniref:Uncharacterized protein n=1 Tax=Roseisolibacter agri TaxID=2014610 RepID=A0AA37QGW5_9BACT|nr:hypothetical protein [Roseisolibacter agri]GLC25568.1 hypothetical protein rosag_20810 [Roseisolibacter agri]
MPRIRSSLLPPVVAWSGDSVTLSGRRFHHVVAPTHELYVESAAHLPALQEQLDASAREFARHFGPAPRVAVLLFDAPADPYRDFDFAPFVARRVQVLAFVRGRDAQKGGTLGVEERLLAARLAELYLAAYADSVSRGLARAHGDTLPTHERALDRLPHWFTEAVVSRVARPDAVERGVTFVKQNRPRLMPLRRLFALARLGMPFWSELAHREGVVRTYSEPTAQTPPPLLAAESTAFGEFLVSRYGPTYLQALADELLAGRSTEDAVAALPGGDAASPALEEAWREWLATAAP